MSKGGQEDGEGSGGQLYEEWLRALGLLSWRRLRGDSHQFCRFLKRETGDQELISSHWWPGTRSEGMTWSYVRRRFRLDIRKRLSSGHSTKSARIEEAFGQHSHTHGGIPGVVFALWMARSWTLMILASPFQPRIFYDSTECNGVKRVSPGGTPQALFLRCSGWINIPAD